MGHLINPIGFRVGWFSGWCDSWFSDAIYYPEFLHDLFRVRLFLNFFFSLSFFEKASLTFSHFEFSYKYATLVMRVFYYDGALMEAMFAFQTDFSNGFLKRKYVRFKKRNRWFLGSRNGRFFLFIFYGFFRFSDFFKNKYLESQKFFQKGSLKFRLYLRRQRRVLKFIRVRRRLELKKRAAKKAEAIAKAKAQGKVYVHYRKPRKHIFFSYGPLFLSRRRRPRFPWRRGLGSARFDVRPKAMQGQEPGPRGFLGKGKTPFYGQRRPLERRGLLGQPFGQKKVSPSKWKKMPFYGQKASYAHFNSNYKKKWQGFKTRKPWFPKPPKFPKPALDPKAMALIRQRRREAQRKRAVFKIFKGILRHCSLGRLGLYLQKVRWLLGVKRALRAELKIFIIFLILFRRIWFLFRTFVAKAVRFDFFKEVFFTASFLFFYNALSFRLLSGVLLSFLKILGLSYVSLKVNIFLLSNDTITASFLAKFIGRKFVQGYRYREVLSPIMHDLYKASRNVKAPKFILAASLQKEQFSKTYKNGVIKSFVLKFLYIYKRLYAKFFWLQGSWVNFYFYRFLALFFKKFPLGLPMLLGFSKKFMFFKQGFLFFFNYDNALFSNNLSFIFNELFFDFFNRAWGQSLFFYFIFDDLFAHGSVLFFGQPWKKLSSNKFYPIGLFFFNRLVRYSYWRYSRSWLIEFNGLNKLKLRFLPRPKGLGLLGFKVHLRGRFSRKQKASSLWYMRGQLPLTSVKSTVDYAFKAYPLRNSLVSVKVWLYKGIFAAKWFVRQF